jgi:hypothetical protein
MDLNYNAHETGIFSNVLNKVPAMRGKIYHGSRKLNNRITSHIGYNADGSDKLPPLVKEKISRLLLFQKCLLISS